MPPANTQEVEIAGLVFICPAPYEEGHECSKIEARVLNQTLAENIGNNFRKKIKDLKTEHGDELPGDVETELRAGFDEYASGYSFTERTVKAPVDPIKRMARTVAREWISNALRQRNFTLKDRPDGWMDEQITLLIEKNPKVEEEARSRIASAKAVAETTLESLGVA